MKTILSICLALCCLIPTLQSQNQITGMVRDAADKPLSFATIMLFTAADTGLVRGTLSTEKGDFIFENIPAGNYFLQFSMLGFKETRSTAFALTEKPMRKEIGNTILSESAAAIGEIQIVALRPFLEQKIDRTVVNVANSITSAGSNALEVLQRSPGVQINRQSKSISMSGKEGVLVMINGKITRVPADAIVQMLEGMNADNIDHIELIHTPPANFEAEGNAGIINIVLKNTGDEGLNGGYSAKIGYGRAEKYGAGAYFNFRKHRINLFGNYGYNFNLNPQVFTNYRGFQQGADFIETDTRSDRAYTPFGAQNAQLGVDFQVTKKTVIGVLGTFADTDWRMRAVNDGTNSKNGSVESRLHMPNSETNRSRSFAGNLNLTHQFSKDQSMNVDVDFINFDIRNPSHYDVQILDGVGTTISQQELRIDKKTPIRVAVAKADYFFNIGEKFKLESGGKITFTRFDNDVRVDSRMPQQDWTVIPEYTALFHLDEDVIGAYSTVSLKADAKTDIKAGLRYEYTSTNLGSAEQPNLVDRKYGSWYPSLFVSRKITEIQNLNFSYSRRITRPQIRQLAPWLIFLDPSTLNGGNPAVQPSFTNALNVDYSVKSYHIGISYSIENGPIRDVPVVDSLMNRQISKPINLNKSKVLGFSLSVPWQPFKWWQMQNNFFANDVNFDYNLEGQTFKNSNFTYGFSSTQTFTLPKHFSLEISGEYSAPNYWGILKWNANGALNVGLQKDFGEKWGKLRANASDILLSSNWIGGVRQPTINLNVKSSYRFAERVFMLSWTNTFGNNKLKSARNRQTGAAEEMRRM